MQIIDTHQHFWKYDPQQHGWINDDMSALRKDFLPADLQPILQRNQVAGCIAVQADQTEAETYWLLELAAANPFIHGVVGWTDLRAGNIRGRLEHFSSFPRLKGFRHILQGEDPGFMLQPGFMNGISALKDFGFTYDILVYPGHLPSLLELVKANPDQPFVIDHLAKPFIRAKQSEPWKKDLAALGAFNNVFCKISGMATEADWNNWTEADMKPYLDAAAEIFGTGRLMFGSDWPVCLPASSYERWLLTVRNYFSAFSSEDQDKVFNRNALNFYHL